MNTLNLIKKQLQAKQKIESYNRSIAYRGIKYDICHKDTATHGTFCYRGRTYTR